MQGGQEITFGATADLTSTTHRQVWARPPIDVDFQVLMFTASGLIVRFLKVFEKSNYHSIKWVRYLTKASGSYQIRVRFFFTITVVYMDLIVYLFSSENGTGHLYCFVNIGHVNGCGYIYGSLRRCRWDKGAKSARSRPEDVGSGDASDRSRLRHERQILYFLLSLLLV